ncbi:MAG: DHHA1 domain-containing protein [Natrialbaceae archaeon]|nr:DHHA1 domain-containing protein [Natrialbaceae archaeon]
MGGRPQRRTSGTSLPVAGPTSGTPGRSGRSRSSSGPSPSRESSELPWRWARLLSSAWPPKSGSPWPSRKSPGNRSRLWRRIPRRSSRPWPARPLTSRPRILSLRPIGRPTGPAIVEIVADVSPEHVSQAVKAVSGERADRIAIVGKEDYTFAVVATTDAIDASAVIRDMNRQFGGGGGGSSDLTQGGGFDASPPDVAAWLEDRLH